MAFPSRWMPLSCALGLFRRFIVHDRSPRVASPCLFPRPESQGGLLDCVSLSLNRPGALSYPSSLSSAGGGIELGRPFFLKLWSPSSACCGCGLRSVPSPSRGSPGRLPSRQGMSVSGFGLSVGPSLGLVLQVLVRSLYREFFLGILDARQTCRVAFPPGGCRSLPSGLARSSGHSLCSWLSVFLYQVTVLPPSPCLVWIFQHAPRLSFESLTPELRMVYPSPLSRIVGAKVLDILCSSVCRLRCTDRPNASKNRIGKLLGSVWRSGFSLPISAPHCLRWGWLCFSTVLNMKEFSIFLGLLAPDDNLSVVPAFVVVLPSPSSVSRVTLSIAPCLLC